MWEGLMDLLTVVAKSCIIAAVALDIIAEIHSIRKVPFPFFWSRSQLRIFFGNKEENKYWYIRSFTLVVDSGSRLVCPASLVRCRSCSAYKSSLPPSIRYKAYVQVLGIASGFNTTVPQISEHYKVRLAYFFASQVAGSPLPTTNPSGCIDRKRANHVCGLSDAGLLSKERGRQFGVSRVFPSEPFACIHLVETKRSPRTTLRRQVFADINQGQFSSTEFNSTFVSWIVLLLRECIQYLHKQRNQQTQRRERGLERRNHTGRGRKHESTAAVTR